jgi:ribosome-associated protein
MSDSYLVIELNHQPVELCKLLKIADLVSGGGEAKVVISEGYVLLNGEVEYQKRKKVYHEDVIEFNGEVVQLLINEELGEPTPDQMEEGPTKATSLNSTLAETEETNEQDSYPSKTKTAQKKAKSKSKPTHQAKKDKTDSEPISQLENVKIPRKRKPISF